MGEDRQSDDQRDRREQTDGNVHVGDRRHSGDRGKDDDKGRDDVLAEHRGNELREDQVQDIAAAYELVAGDGRIGEQDRDDTKDAGGLVVARFEQVGNGELRELASARRDEIDQQQPGPSAASLPQRREAVAIGVLRAAEQRARPDPTA